MFKPFINLFGGKPAMQHTSFQTSTKGLNRALPPMMLFEKAKRLGVWNPADIDFSQDKKDWAGLTPEQHDITLQLLAHFVSGEEAVTLDLLPLINVIAKQGRLEEEMFLTTFLWEEAKHIDFFSRFLEEVCGGAVNLGGYVEGSENYRYIFCDVLPRYMGALETDHSAAALARASAVYNMIVEGTLAETGYHAFFTIMDRHNILPGMRGGIQKLKLDESRHIAYGVYLLSRLMSEDPGVWEVVEETMNELLAPALGIVNDSLGRFDPMPYDITPDEFSTYAAMQFQKRLERVRKARDMSLDQLNAETLAIIQDEDA